MPSLPFLNGATAFAKCLFGGLFTVAAFHQNQGRGPKIKASASSLMEEKIQGANALPAFPK